MAKWFSALLAEAFTHEDLQWASGKGCLVGLRPEDEPLTARQHASKIELALGLEREAQRRGLTANDVLRWFDAPSLKGACERLGLGKPRTVEQSVTLLLEHLTH